MTFGLFVYYDIAMEKGFAKSPYLMGIQAASATAWSTKRDIRFAVGGRTDVLLLVYERQVHRSWLNNGNLPEILSTQKRHWIRYGLFLSICRTYIVPMSCVMTDGADII